MRSNRDLFTRLGFRHGAIALALVLLVGSVPAAPPKPSPVPDGQRVFSCGHSLHFFVPPLLTEMATAAGIKGHEVAGTSIIGGSRVIQHWNVPEDMNKAKEALRAGKVDVITLAPIYMPDEGIEKFARLALEHNPKVRVTVQEFSVLYDVYDTANPLGNRAVDRNAADIAELRKLHEPYFKSIDDHVREVNKTLGKEAVFVVPVGQAVLALREKIVAGQAPGLKEQGDLFTDAIGHASPPLMALYAYCQYAVVYRRSPVGLPMPSVLAKANNTSWDENLNRLLQELAWEAVTQHPLSGVKAKK